MSVHFGGILRLATFYFCRRRHDHSYLKRNENELCRVENVKGNRELSGKETIKERIEKRERSHHPEVMKSTRISSIFKS